MSVEIMRKEEEKGAPGCAFCQGKGIDPFELLSKLSTCQVCMGRGQVTTHQPAIECAYCSGTGVHIHRRLTCTVCGGKGAVTIKEPVGKCPDCKGRGIRAGEYLPCIKCRGKGVVTRRIKNADR